MENSGLTGAIQALAEDADRVLEAWIDRYEASTLRLPGDVDPLALRALFGPVISALKDGLSAEDLRPGAPELREIEKDLSFLGANFSASGASAFDAAALALALRDVVANLAEDDAERRQIQLLFDWFMAITLEGFAHGHTAAVTERYREHLEERTPVVLAAPDIPAAFPIGDSNVHGLRGAFARIALQVARVGARVVIVDASGLMDPGAPEVLEAVREYCSHRKISRTVGLVTAGLTDAQRREWAYVARSCNVTFDSRDTFGDALQLALDRSDFSFVRKENS